MLQKHKRPIKGELLPSSQKNKICGEVALTPPLRINLMIINRDWEFISQSPDLE